MEVCIVKLHLLFMGVAYYLIDTARIALWICILWWRNSVGLWSMFRFEHWLILHLQKIEILLNILVFNSLRTQCHPVLPHFCRLSPSLLLVRGYLVRLDLNTAQTDTHEQLPIAHAQLEIHVVPILNEMPWKILNWIAEQLDSDIVPRHAGDCLPVYRTHPKIARSVDVSFPVVAVVYPGPKLCSGIGQ